MAHGLESCSAFDLTREEEREVAGVEERSGGQGRGLAKEEAVGGASAQARILMQT